MFTVATPETVALQALRGALDASPDDAALWTELGRRLRLAGDAPGAEAAYRRAVELDPAAVQAWLGLGLLLKAESRLPEAADALTHAIRAYPGFADGYNNLGNVLLAQGRRTPAAMAYRAAIRRDPRHADAHSNLSVLLRRQGRWREALDAATRATEAAPGSAVAWFNRANAATELELPEADEAYRRAIALRPQWIEPRFSHALWLLREGRLREGFAGYEWRWARPDAKALAARFPVPRWSGQPLEDKVVLVTAEQGLGDAIQCARFLPLLARRGATVLIEAKPATRDLLATVHGVVRVVMEGDAVSRLDYQCPQFSLPHAFGVELDTIPAGVPYLHPPEALIARWGRALPQARRRIGLVWQGNPGSKVEKGRSFPLAALRPVFTAAGPDAAFVCLQHEHGLDQLGDGPVASLGPDFQAGSLLDTAAIVAGLDLVIACDTAVAHLAGALGKPVWIALKAPAEWRWLRDRPDSPWYPTARLYRQTVPGDWSGVFAAMAEDLATL